MACRILVLPRAARALRKLDPPVMRRVVRRIDRLAEEPRPPDARALTGEPAGILRIRVGDWRVLYRIEDDVLTIAVIDVGHRSSIYRR